MRTNRSTVITRVLSLSMIETGSPSEFFDSIIRLYLNIMNIATGIENCRKTLCLTPNIVHSEKNTIPIPHSRK